MSFSSETFSPLPPKKHVKKKHTFYLAAALVFSVAPLCQSFQFLMIFSFAVATQLTDPLGHAENGGVGRHLLRRVRGWAHAVRLNDGIFGWLQHFHIFPSSFAPSAPLFPLQAA